MFYTKDFDYNLPPELIAQGPISPRDHSRLLLLDKKNGKIEHKHFYDIIDHFDEGDMLVMNNSKVFPARLIGKRKETGGKLEIFLLRSMLRSKESCVWQCMVGGRRAKPGLQVEFAKGLVGELKKDNEDQTWEVEFNYSYDEMMELVDKIGEVPLPPYIKSHNTQHTTHNTKRNDKNDYQTVYANDSKIGSVAAPTAGFHFTPELLKKIKARGVQIEYVTLHVGMGTFAPVKVETITKHKMHSEFVEIEKEVIKKINATKKSGKRIITVGTTSTRTLESYFSNPKSYKLQVCPEQGRRAKSYTSWVDIFIYPGYEFKIVDAMITNFHLPKSTLVMLVSALAGKENIEKAYTEAIKEKYRFYSYGDAMFIK